MPDRPNADDPDDDQLMRRYAAGDARAFERLYLRHEAGLHRFVRRLLGPLAATQADEVFQDTWERVMAARERWQPQGASFRTWLFTLAHHRAVDCLRRSGRELSVPDDEDGDPWEPAGTAWSGWPAAPATDEAADRHFWRRAGQRLLDCLAQLPPGQRAAFLLHHEDGLRVDEVAQALSLGFETAKSRLRYALTRLRACMGAHLPGDAL